MNAVWLITSVDARTDSRETVGVVSDRERAVRLIMLDACRRGIRLDDIYVPADPDATLHVFSCDGAFFFVGFKLIIDDDECRLNADLRQPCGCVSCRARR